MSKSKHGKPRFQDWDTFRDWPRGTILGFDQSMANTGWAEVSFIPGLRPVLYASGTIRTAPSEELTGFYDSFNRGDYLFDTYSALIGTALSKGMDGIAHEMPANMGAVKSSNGEAPIIAAMALRSAVRAQAPLVPLMIVPATRAKATASGRKYAEKSEMRTAVMRILGYETWRTNEHVTDAVAIAVTAALDGILSEEEN